MLDAIPDISQRANLLRFTDLSPPAAARPQPIDVSSPQGGPTAQPTARPTTQPTTQPTPQPTFAVSTQPCAPRPDIPDLPGYQQQDVEHGPNDFTLELTGPDPDLAVGGSHDQQESRSSMQAAWKSARRSPS